MGTRVTRWIDTTTIDTNGLGKVIKKESYRNGYHHEHDYENGGHGHYTHDVENSYDFYLEPEYGVEIERIEKTTTFTGKDGKTETYVSMCDAYEYSIISYGSHGEDVRGCFRISKCGEEEDIFVETHPDLESHSETCRWDRKIKIIGRKNPGLKLDFIGNNHSKRCLFYTMLGKPPEERTKKKCLVVFLNESETPQTYTNLVAFDKTYDLNGTDIPQGRMWFGGFHEGFDGAATPSTYLLKDKDTAINVLVKSCTSKICMMTHYTSLMWEDETPPKHIIVYVNCFFAIFRSNLYSRLLSEQESDRLLTPYQVTVPMAEIKYGSKDPRDAYISEMERIPFARLQHKQPDEKLIKIYASKCIRDRWVSQGSNYQNLDFATGNSYTLDRKHRWLERLRFSYNNTDDCISRFWNFVMLVDSSTANGIKIKDKIDAYSSYARFTGFYLMKNHELRAVVDGAEHLHSSRCNQLYYPIFKSWAECDILVFDEEDDKPEDEKAFTKDSYEFFEEYLDGNYVNEEGTFRKHYYINASKSSQENSEKIRMFASTSSPFKNEFYCCHGSRTEYDQQTYENILADYHASNPDDYSEDDVSDSMANGNICYSKDYALGNKDFKSIHDAIAYWNSFPCVGIYIESCFGSGMQKGFQRPVLGNCLCKQGDGWKLYKDISNMWHYIDSRATHPSYGSDTSSLSLGVIRKVTDGLMAQNPNSEKYPSYKMIAETFNALVGRVRERVFAEIKKFYQENFELMVSCLPNDADRTMWRETKNLILEDLTNNGNKYFSMFDWSEKFEIPRKSGNWVEGSGFNASDNFFFPQEKKYRINDGFYGYIKRKIFKDTASSYNKAHRPIMAIVENFEEDMELYENLLLLDGKTNELDDKIKHIIGDMFNVDINRCGIYKDVIVCNPVIGNEGVFRNDDTEFMKNPWDWVDLHLTSDEDLRILSQKASV